MTATEQTTQQTMDRTSTMRASVELSERGGSVSIDGTFHALRASNVDDARMEALELLRRFAGDVGGPVTVRSTEPSGVFDFLINPDGLVLYRKRLLPRFINKRTAKEHTYKD